MSHIDDISLSLSYFRTHAFHNRKNSHFVLLISLFISSLDFIDTHTSHHRRCRSLFRRYHFVGFTMLTITCCLICRPHADGCRMMHRLAYYFSQLVDLGELLTRWSLATCFARVSRLLYYFGISSRSGHSLASISRRRDDISAEINTPAAFHLISTSARSGRYKLIDASMPILVMPFGLMLSATAADYRRAEWCVRRRYGCVNTLPAYRFFSYTIATSENCASVCDASSEPAKILAHCRMPKMTTRFLADHYFMLGCIALPRISFGLSYNLIRRNLLVSFARCRTFHDENIDDFTFPLMVFSLLLHAIFLAISSRTHISWFIISAFDVWNTIYYALFK